MVGRLGKVFILPVMVSVVFGSEPLDISRPVDWLYGRSITTGDRFYLEPAEELNTLSLDQDASYMVNDGIQCIPAIHATLKDRESLVRRAWVTVVHGETHEQEDYSVLLNLFDKTGNCFLGASPQIHATSVPGQVLSELNSLCIDYHFRLIKSSSTTDLTDGKYTGKNKQIGLEVDVRGGKIEHVAATPPSASIESLKYFTIGEVILIRVERMLQSGEPEEIVVLLEPINRKAVLQYDRVNRENLKYWDRDPPPSKTITEEPYTAKGAKKSSRAKVWKYVRSFKKNGPDYEKI